TVSVVIIVLVSVVKIWRGLRGERRLQTDDQRIRELSERHRNAGNALLFEKPRFHARGLIREHRPVHIGGTLHDLTCETARELVVKTAAKEQETAFLAPGLHGCWNGSLDVDFSQYLDKIAVGNKIISGWSVAAKRAVQQQTALLHFRQQFAARGIGPEPVTKMLGLRQPLCLDPVTLRARLGKRRRESVVVPSVDHQSGTTRKYQVQRRWRRR